MTLRTWNDNKRCAECCNGDRCDDPTHHDRANCPHCKGTGWALWTEAGRTDFVDYLVRRGLDQYEAQQRLNAVLEKP